MLTEGWDCSTVTHIIGMRPFMSQLLCEQVVGRGLRRASYEVDEDDKFTEEVSHGVGCAVRGHPVQGDFADTGHATTESAITFMRSRRKRSMRSRFPRVEGYTQAIRNRVTMDWANVPTMVLTPDSIPPEVRGEGLERGHGGTDVAGWAGQDQQG